MWRHSRWRRGRQRERRHTHVPVVGCRRARQSSSAAAAPANQREAALKFAQCMREHGIDMPDPEPGGPVAIQECAGDGDKAQKAQEACKEFSADLPLKP